MEREVKVILTLDGPEDVLNAITDRFAEGRAKIDLPRDHNGHEFVRITAFYDGQYRGISHIEVPVIAQHFEVSDVRDLMSHERPLLSVDDLDQAHLEEPLSGRVTFIFIEKMRDDDALRHLREIHHVPPNFRDGEMAAVHEQHTKLHPVESHCHAKGGHRTTWVHPMLDMMNTAAQIEHLARQHCVEVQPLQDINEVHRMAHAHGCDHEHRRH